jgi:two-component system response regulator AtoC
MEAKGKTVLLVDDEEKFLRSISERIRLMGFEPLKARNGREALEIAGKNIIDIAIVDMKMPGMDGLVTITKLKEIRPGVRTILLTGYGNEKIKEATDALDTAYFEKDQMGDLWSFLKKLDTTPAIIVVNPSSPPGRAGTATKELAYEISPEKEETLTARKSLGKQEKPISPHADSGEYYHLQGHRLIGETSRMQELKKNIARVAALDCTVMIRGETGSGKELVARAVHDLSPRMGNRFLAINCGSFTQELLSSELFGVEKDALTGSVQTKRGVFEAVSGGSILLDEIGELPYQMQAQLLRVLQEKTIVRVGGTEERGVDVRIMAATSQTLRKKVEEKKFREDLYNQLNLFELHVCPLRERRDDIPPLCSYFIAKLRKQFDKKVEYISDEVMSILMAYPFPNNVRELENIIERAVILAEGRAIERKDLPERLRRAEHFEPKRRRKFATLAELQNRYIMEVLEATGGNKTKAGELLGISRGALWRKLKRLETVPMERVRYEIGDVHKIIS